MTNEQNLRKALTDLVEQCRDYFHGDSGFPMADALERAEAVLKQDEPREECQHDFSKAGHTIMFTHDLRPLHEFNSVATCRVCRQQWNHPLAHVNRTGDA